MLHFLLSFLLCFNIKLLKTIFVGAIHSPVYRTSVPSGLHGVPESERDRRPQLCEGDGLPGSPEQPGDIWR